MKPRVHRVITTLDIKVIHNEITIKWFSLPHNIQVEEKNRSMAVTAGRIFFLVRVSMWTFIKIKLSFCYANRGWVYINICVSYIPVKHILFFILIFSCAREKNWPFLIKRKYSSSCCVLKSNQNKNSLRTRDSHICVAVSCPYNLVRNGALPLLFKNSLFYIRSIRVWLWN